MLIYFVPDRNRLVPLRFMVHQNILRNLHYAGIEIPVPAQEIRVRRGAPAVDAAGAIVRLIRQSALFAELTAGETEELAQAATQHLRYAGDPILKQGNPGSSLFILNEGLLGVWMKDAAGTDRQVAQIQPGEFFGELSLHTGAPRIVEGWLDTYARGVKRRAAAAADNISARSQTLVTNPNYGVGTTEYMRSRGGYGMRPA